MSPGIYQWSIILADTDFFQQSELVSAANFRGRLNRPSTFYQIFCSLVCCWTHKSRFHDLRHDLPFLQKDMRVLKKGKKNPENFPKFFLKFFLF